jgi:hypothetical protein
MIGYAHDIIIFRYLEKHPEQRFHPVFKWFRQWCKGECSHREAFSLIVRSDRKLPAVVSASYVRSQMRPNLDSARRVIGGSRRNVCRPVPHHKIALPLAAIVSG